MKKILSLFIAFAFTFVLVGSASAQYGRSEDRAAKNELSKAQSDMARQKAKERVEKIKTEVAERKVTIKLEVCQRKQEKIEKLMPRLANGATSVKAAIDKMYERVQGFYEKGQLTVSNYDELNTNVALAKLNAEVSLEAIETFEFEIDCENKGVGQQLDGYREVVKEAKESLKDYRTELVNLISEMRSAAADKSDDAAGGSEGEEEQTQGEVSNE